MKYPIRLESKRLYTRPLEYSDIEIWNEFIQDEKATRLFPESMKKPDTASVWIKKQIERYSNNDFGLMALIDKESGDFIGQCGLLNQNLQTGNEVEIGYHILPKFWGQGFATEASALIKNYGLNELGLKRIVSVINSENIASQKVAKNNGMNIEDRITYRDMPADLWVYEV